MSVALVLGIATLAVLLLWRACRLPVRPTLVPSPALAPHARSGLGKLLAPLVAQHAGQTGIQPIDDARLAFAARVLLARRATLSLDIQYYIWRGDISGRLLLEELFRAAKRGVRVRLLVDDNGTAGLDAELVALDRLANAEVRLFNPFMLRWPRVINYIFDFPRLNRRMHNKSFTADGVATIVGGRNVGDEYFGASREQLFADMDVLAVGEIVSAVSADFDRYWSCASAWPVAAVVRGAPRPRRPPADHRRLTGQYRQVIADAVAERLLTGTDAFEWTQVRMVSDDPTKGLGQAPHHGLLAAKLGDAMGAPTRSLGLISAYFVPTRAGTQLFTGLADGGVDVAILTNALRATDVALVHAGYATCRRTLLEAGVQLWELKGGEADRVRLGLRPSGSRPKATFRSRGSALHAKTFSIDRKRLFVGSFNFDPRSIRLNTELGFVIESPVLATRLQDLFETRLFEAAYRLTLQHGKLAWIEALPDGPIVHTTEPGTRWYQRQLLALIGRLPIEPLL